MIPEAATLEGRFWAESLMTDSCTVFRPGSEATDPETGVVSPTFTTAYTGKCKVQSSGLQAKEEAAGATNYYFGQLAVHFPVTSQLRIDDQVVIDASPMDPDLVGLRLRLVEMARGTYKTADRWAVELWVK
ncbi:DUF6093 family protein [Zhihengliuella alba]|uniref:DUF6093 family protein n=1 Tax=Zhihengliuella alba TaxID=547018 RepID=A0ABP7D0T0_9MICC